MPIKDDINEGMLEDIPFLDKLVHFGIFLILTLLYYFYNIKIKIAYLIIFPLFIGLLIEILQHLLPTNRSFDWFDLLADFVGVIFALVFIVKK